MVIEKRARKLRRAKQLSKWLAQSCKPEANSIVSWYIPSSADLLHRSHQYPRLESVARSPASEEITSYRKSLVTNNRCGVMIW